MRGCSATAEALTVTGLFLISGNETPRVRLFVPPEQYVKRRICAYGASEDQSNASPFATAPAASLAIFVAIRRAPRLSLRSRTAPPFPHWNHRIQTIFGRNHHSRCVLRMTSVMKVLLGATAGATILASSIITASAAVVCNGNVCWHVHERYTYPPSAGVVIHEDDWRPVPGITFREHEGRGYWRGDDWTDF
jgi:hypothetical protein